MQLKFIGFIVLFCISNGLFGQTECFEFFHENGNLSSTECYDDNWERVGNWKFYFDNNQLMREETYKNNAITGKVIVYFRNGTVNKEISYSKKGRKRIERIFSKKGIKISETTYIGFREEGNVFKFHRDTGELLSRTAYKNGKRHGKHIVYNKVGDIRWLENYKEGKKHGRQIIYYENGNIKQEENYKLNSWYGKKAYYYENGIVKVCYEYGDNSKILNILEVNDINGNPLDKGTLKDGNGTYYEYDDQGNKKYTFEIKDGRRTYKKR